jgi:two-component system chemotaxis response regulator CheY
MAVKVLLVDDLSFVRMVQKDILGKQGYEIVGEASDGIDGVRQYEILRPDVVVMDITMPNMNGLDAVRRILGIDPQARIIICSALGQQKLIMNAINLGIKDFIVKPFKPERLLSAISRAVSAQPE